MHNGWRINELIFNFQFSIFKIPLDSFALSAGTVLVGERRYTIERLLGSGGFGKTYLASTSFTVGNISVRGYVAVKEHFVADHNEREADTLRVTTPGTARSRQIVADSLRDFIGEARRLQQLGAGHPNIVKVNEVFEANDTAYYVMEYLEGTSLWSAVDGKPMAEGDMLALMAPIIDAVAYLHRNRLTHLDIKPQNIMLATADDGSMRPVLIDFGLSKHYDANGNATSTVNTLACSDGYSPVEQYSGITTFSPSSDVYALGATMLACLIGKTPQKSTEWPAGERMRYIDTLPVSEPLRSALCGALGDIHTRTPDAGSFGGEVSLQAKRSAVINLPTPGPTTSATRPVERRYSAAGPSPVTPSGPSPVTPDSDATRPASASRKPVVKNSRAIILIALSALILFVSGYLAYQAYEAQYPPNLSLAVEKNGVQSYFYEDEWNDMSAAEQNQYTKLGVVINKDHQRFILALDCVENGRDMHWRQAMSRYSNVMPTKRQCEAILAQNAAVRHAIEAFGGSRAGNGFWTNEGDDASYAWRFDIDNGFAYINGERNTFRVRAVAPVPVASAR